MTQDLAIEQQLARQDPETYQSYVAGMLVDLGNLDIRQNRLAAAIATESIALPGIEREPH